MANKSTKKGLLYQEGFSLTEAEKEVLQLLTEEFLTPKQIRIKRECSKQAVYKIIKSLKQKGVLTNGNNKVDLKGGSSQPSHQRLHSQQFRIRLISKSQKYHKVMDNSNMIEIDGNTIRLYKDILEIYSNKSFFGVDEQEATNKSLSYWKSFITRLENEFGVILQKPRTQNIRIVKQHYAETNSKLAKESQRLGKEIKVYCNEDNKLAVIMDNSFNLNERECIHPEHNKQHSEAISKQVSDFIENDPPTNSELQNSIAQLTNISAQQQNQIIQYTKQIASHLKLIQEYRKENIRWRKSETAKINKQITNQKRLNEFL